MAGPHSTRRRLLATLGTASLTGLAGCGSGSELEGEGDTIEIMPRNGTDFGVTLTAEQTLTPWYIC
jgi:hypothetical protein